MNIYTKTLLAITFSLIAFTAIHPSVYAHVLATDGSIGAILHIEPEDDPIAGQPSSFFFEFKDTKNAFTATSCSCYMQILRHGSVIYSDALFQQVTDKHTNTAYSSFTFPQTDAYQIHIIGKPKSDNVFLPFTLSYEIRVSRTANQSPTASQTPTFPIISLLAIIIAVLITALFFIFSFFKKTSSSKKRLRNNKNYSEKEARDIY